MPYSLTKTAEGTEPVTLVEAKLHQRIDHTSEDALLVGLITTAREMAEAFTHRAIVQSIYQLAQPCWWSGYLELPLPPLVSVDAVEYRAPGDTVYTPLDSAIWTPYPDFVPALVGLDPDASLPEVNANDPLAVRITFQAGYTSDNIPRAIATAIMVMVGHLYEQRSAATAGGEAPSTKIPFGFEAMLSTWRFGDMH